MARHRVGAKGARAFAGAYRGVDPVAVDELAHDVGQLGREAVVRVDDQRRGLRPAHLSVGVGHAGRTVVVGQPLDAEHLRLQPVPALGQVVAGDDRIDQRVHRLVGGLVGQVAARQPARVRAQAVLHRLVEQQGVVDVGPGAKAGLQGGRDRPGRICAHPAVGVLQQRQPLLERRRAIPAGGRLGHGHLDRRGLLVEEPHPGGCAGHRRLGQHLLLGLAQQVVPVAAQGAQVVGAEVEGRVGEQRLSALVGHRRPLQVEEHQLGRQFGGGLGQLGHRCAALGVEGVLGQAQADVGAGPAQQVVQLADRAHERRHPCGIQRIDRAAGFGDLVGQGRCPIHQLIGRRPVEQAIELPGNVRCGEVGGLGIGGGRIAGGSSVGGVGRSALRWWCHPRPRYRRRRPAGGPRPRRLRRHGQRPGGRPCGRTPDGAPGGARRR